MRPHPFRCGAAALAMLLASCAEPARTMLEPAPGARDALAAVSLLDCPAATTVSASATVDPLLGGVLRVTDAAGGTSQVLFPAGVVSVPTVFVLTLPASPHLKARVQMLDPLTGLVVPVSFPAGLEPTVSVSARRCGSWPEGASLALYNVDPDTDAVLEGPYGASDGSAADPRVTGRVPHFSDYAIGTN